MKKLDGLSIDGWEIDASSCRIIRDGIEKKLQPRSMTLLLYLAKHPNQVVSREDIEDHVWQDRVVGYDSLSSSIAKIRKAFEDTSTNPRVIETIPKLGYRLISPVLVETSEYQPFASESQSGNFERKLTAIFYADVAGYSRLTGEDEDRTHRQLRDNMKSISDAIIRYEGRIIHYAGDAVLSEFSTASTALQCALEVQHHISRFSSHIPENQRVLFRIGVNLGEVIVDGDEIYGDGVNVAARLEGLAEPGGVCISGTVFESIGQKQNFEFAFLGESTVKNIERPIQTYAVYLKSGSEISSPTPIPSFKPDSQSRLKGKQYPLVVLSIVVIVLGLLISGGFALYSINPDGVESVSASKSNIKSGALSLAILPFKNSGDTPGQVVYADGLTDDLITDLSSIAGLQVIPRHSSFQYKKTDIPLIDIAQNLEVRYIVQGSVRWSLNDIRVNVQMVDAKSNQEIWSQRYDDNVQNIFSLQDRIIGEILANLDIQSAQKSKSKRRTTNLEAYDYFLRAEHRRLSTRRSKTAAKVLEFYQLAIELDPLFIAAYTGLAREALTNWRLGDNQVMPAAAWKKLIYETAGKALELDPVNAETLAILGLLQAVSGEHDAGIASVKKAVAINPSNPQLNADLAAVLSYGGNHHEALKSINRAIGGQATPPSAFYRERARINFFLGRLKNALQDTENDSDNRDIRDFSMFIQAALDYGESAQQLASIRLEARPWEDQASYSEIFAYYRRPQDIELLVETAAKAGIP